MKSAHRPGRALMSTRLWRWVVSRWNASRDQQPMDDHDLDQFHAWSISAPLAAVPSGYLERVPDDVAALIRAAKGLHVEMADGAERREAGMVSFAPLTRLPPMSSRRQYDWLHLPASAQSKALKTPQRRKFSTANKGRILLAADRGTQPGKIGALVRAEGVCSSSLSA